MIPKARESLAESPAVAARRFYYDDLVFDPGAIRFLVESFGPAQIVVGSDYPFNMGDSDPIGTLEAAGLSPVLREAIMTENARRFLGRAAAATR